MPILSKILKADLVVQIIAGLIIGTVIALVWPNLALSLELLGSLFIGALKGVAPVVVFILVAAAITQHKSGSDVPIKSILALYVVGTLSAAIIAILASKLFPVTIKLNAVDLTEAAPSSVVEVIKTLLMNMVQNPVSAIANGNFIGILMWAILIGIALRHASDSTKLFFDELATASTDVICWIIRLAPIGVLGIVASTVAKVGVQELLVYGKLVAVLVGAMFFTVLVVHPLIIFLYTRRNPYPLVWLCLRRSAITAFFTRSSAANIPVNLALCEKMKLHKDTYAISIPLGATINMPGGAITITVLTLAAVHTLGISTELPVLALLAVIAAVGACGSSGVPGGSLLLIPMACHLFGISPEISAQVVGVGFVIGVLQDSCETALNSSADPLFTATAEWAKKRS